MVKEECRDKVARAQFKHEPLDVCRPEDQHCVKVAVELAVVTTWLPF